MKPIEERIVFVGGLHRSGTTPLASWLGMHPDVSNLSNTGVYADEGQHLQSVYPTAMAHGGPGRFALDPEAHLEADSRWVTPEAQARLIEAWSPYWDVTRQTLVEKSPPNLIRLPYLNALFPCTRFIVIVRHPIAVSVATSKWTGRDLDVLLRNWAAAHDSFLDQATRVGPVTVLRYEDLMADPQRTLQRLFAFLSLPGHDGAWPVRHGVNEDYFAQFQQGRFRWRRAERRRLLERYQPSAARFGYDMLQPEILATPAPEITALMGPVVTDLG